MTLHGTVCTTLPSGNTAAACTLHNIGVSRSWQDLKLLKLSETPFLHHSSCLHTFAKQRNGTHALTATVITGTLWPLSCCWGSSHPTCYHRGYEHFGQKPRTPFSRGNAAALTALTGTAGFAYYWSCRWIRQAGRQAGLSWKLQSRVALCHWICQEAVQPSSRAVWSEACCRSWASFFESSLSATVLALE